MLSCFHSFSDYSLTPGFGFVKVLFGSFWFILVHPSKIGVPSSIMRKFVYKSGRTKSAQGREPALDYPIAEGRERVKGGEAACEALDVSSVFCLSASHVFLHLKVLHVHVLLAAPLGSGDMTQSGTNQHECGVAIGESPYNTRSAPDLPI